MQITRLNLADDKTAERILTIQQTAYRIEAEWTGIPEIPPLLDTQEWLIKSGETFYGCYVETMLAGFVSFELKDDRIEICRLGVQPDYFRRGIASALLTCVEAAYPDVPRLVVSTLAANQPARRLYEQCGFTLFNEAEVEPGLMMAYYEKWRL